MITLSSAELNNLIFKSYFGLQIYLTYSAVNRTELNQFLISTVPCLLHTVNWVTSELILHCHLFSFSTVPKDPGIQCTSDPGTLIIGAETGCLFSFFFLVIYVPL